MSFLEILAVVETALIIFVAVGIVTILMVMKKDEQEIETNNGKDD